VLQSNDYPPDNLSEFSQGTPKSVHAFLASGAPGKRPTRFSTSRQIKALHVGVATGEEVTYPKIILTIE
jgi:hypothetical protein